MRPCVRGSRQSGSRARNAASTAIPMTRPTTAQIRSDPAMDYQKTGHQEQPTETCADRSDRERERRPPYSIRAIDKAVAARAQ